MKLILAATIAALAVPASAEAVRVSTKAGVIVGEAADGVRVFRGVPYAQPPVGPLRWAAPKPIAWKGPRQATAFAPPCLQPDGANGRPNGGGHSGPSSEDCLYLNVWAPAATAKAPIMLWLYGGGGIMGGGHLPGYSGDAFARDGVVLVTINYRLGALGGFAHPSLTRAGDGLGNYHLLDALAAIRWIKANATAFGGDPDNITVFGESAGATMVANLLAMPGAKGLFAKAIIQSTGSLRRSRTQRSTAPRPPRCSACAARTPPLTSFERFRPTR